MHTTQLIPFLKSTIAIISMIFTLHLQAQTHTEKCLCGDACTCKISSETPKCKCSEGCKCKPKKIACRCGDACQCTQGDKSLCICLDCQCQSAKPGSPHGHNPSTNPLLKMMDSMMIKMDQVPLTGNAEQDFLAQMIPHHQGAIEMAHYVIKHGTNNEIKQLAKAIIAEQQVEIMKMSTLLAKYPTSKRVDHQIYKKEMDNAMAIMMQQTPTDAELSIDVDCYFCQIMLPHHQAAIDMSIVLLKLQNKGQIATFARRIIGDQQIEIEQMKEYISKNCKR